MLEEFWFLQGYFYYIFGFCFVVGALTVLITIEVAVVCTYVQLCAEDYTWWWVSHTNNLYLVILCISSAFSLIAWCAWMYGERIQNKMLWNASLHDHVLYLHMCIHGRQLCNKDGFNDHVYHNFGPYMCPRKSMLSTNILFTWPLCQGKTKSLSLVRPHWPSKMNLAFDVKEGR